MGILTIFLLILIVLFGIYSFVLLTLNKSVVYLDLLFLGLDIQLGLIILSSVLFGIMITVVLETIFFSSKSKKKDE